MTLSLDQAVYAAADSPAMTARLTIRNEASNPVTLTFLSGQVYDLEIRNEKGDVVYRWSTGKVFPQIVFDDVVDGEKDYWIAAPLAGLPAGNYSAQAWLVVEGPPKSYSASASFRIA